MSTKPHLPLKFHPSALRNTILKKQLDVTTLNEYLIPDLRGAKEEAYFIICD